ncbi:hypothetical protein QFC19_004504 [Naganishia cerealis]|uniref:Uncharacterized protein n=1 Tax=Naganishia cerealis TaxID=610337 RepID=A0ACC2VUY4_9TREE|nr:hypothetical protein QFC19_004504 [Naganishia cerealis]
MAYPLYRPQRTSFSDHSVLGFQEYNTSSLTGRKRSNQAAELSDVSVDDDVNDNEVQQLGIMKKTGWEKAVEGDDDRQSRKISCSGRRRSSAKGARKEGESQTVSSSTQKGPIITESEAEAIPNVLQREERIDEAQQDPTATSHSSEMPNSAGDSSSSHLETSSSDITVHPSENTRGGEEMATASVSETFDEEREPSLDRERECLKTERVWGMPDWAAELDEVVPGVKVMSIQDTLQHLFFSLGCMGSAMVLSVPMDLWSNSSGKIPPNLTRADKPFKSSHSHSNPPLTPPRYRGLCVLKAPEAPVTLFQDERQSSESMKPLRSSSSASQSSNEPSYSSYNQGSASINIQSPESPASYISRDRAASTSTYLSTISSATWASTDSSDPSLYSLSSSPQSVTTLGTDCEGKFGDASTRNGAVSVNSMSLTDDIDQHEGNAVGQPIEVAMHPTCSKRMLGVETGNRDASPSGNGNTVDSARAHTGSNDIVMDVDMEMEVEFQIPLSVSHDSASLAGTRTPQTSPPPTPQASLSAHPTEENSILRTASGKGRMRSASPTPVNNASPIGRPETLTRASSERNAPSGREDSKSDHVDQTLAAQHRSQIQEEQSTGNQPSTCQNRSMLINAIKTEDILDLDVSAAQGVFKKPDLGGEVSLRNLRIQEIKYASIADLLIYSENGLSNENVQDLRDPLIRTAFSIARAQAKLYQERLASFYSDLKAPPVSPYSRPCDDFQTSDASSTHEHAYSSNDSANVPMNQDLPDEVEGQAYSTDDLLLQLRDREQWQNDHLPERPIMYNVVVIKESFAEIQRYFPELVGTDANGASQPPRDLWVKEAEESIRLAGSSELGENVWWKTFGLSASKNLNVEKKLDERLLETSLTKPGDSWINHEKFDGSLPSRILPHVYLGNMSVTIPM